MDLNELYGKIESYAQNTRGVETVTISDPYTSWNSLHMKYGAFNTALNYVNFNDSTVELHFTFYYGDKVANDSSNIHQIQTTGFNVIRNVVAHLENEYQTDGGETLQIFPFTQKFADILAGAYADVVIYLPLDSCFNYDKE